MTRRFSSVSGGQLIARELLPWSLDDRVTVYKPRRGSILPVAFFLRFYFVLCVKRGDVVGSLYEQLAS